jgi:hypothetical protein
VLYTADIAIDGETGWFASNAHNGLYEINLENGNLKFLDLFPGEDIEKQGLFARIYKFKDKLFCVPRTAEDIYIYHLKNSKFGRIAVPKIEQNLEYQYNKFFTAVPYQNYLYLIPGFYPFIVKLNMDSCKIEKCIELSHADCKNSGLPYFATRYVKEDNKLYLFTIPGYQIFELDFLNDKFELHKVENGDNWYRTISLYQDLLLLGDRNGEITLWNRKSHLRQDFPLSTKNVIIQTDSLYMFSEIVNDNMLLFPGMGKDVLKYNIETKKTEKVVIPADFNTYLNQNNENALATVKKMNENEILIVLKNDDKIIRLRSCGENLEWKLISVTCLPQLRKREIRISSFGIPMIENENLAVKDLIDFLKDNQRITCNDGEQKDGQSIGRTVHNTILGYMQ